MSKNHTYRITYVDQEDVNEIYARSICESEIFGFIEVSEFVFGGSSSVVVDPSVERLKLEFANVKCSMIPAQSIIRIDIVEKEGLARTIGKRTGNTIGTNVSNLFPK